MTTSELQRVQQNDLQTKLWDIANDLRGSMDPSEFKNYILGLIFYRYLSENLETKANKLLEDDEMTYGEAWKDEEYREALKEELVNDIGYYIEPKYLFDNLLDEIEKGSFDIETLEEAVNNITESTLGQDSEEDF